MLKAGIIDPSARELSRSAQKVGERRLGEIALRVIDTTRPELVSFLWPCNEDRQREKDVAPCG